MKKAVKRQQKKGIKESAKEAYGLYKKSFSRLATIDSLLIICFELLFYALLIGGNFVSKTILESQKSFIMGMSAASLMLLSIFVLLFFVVFLACIYSLSRGLLWNLLLNKRFTLKYWYSFTKLNLIWFVAWLMPVLSFGYLYSKMLRSAEGNVILMNLFLLITWILIALCFHFIFQLHYSFTKKNHPIEAVKNAWHIGKKIQLFVMPYIMLFATLLIISLVLKIFKILPQSVQAVIYLVVFLIFIVWFRYYIAEVVMSVEQTINSEHSKKEIIVHHRH